MMIVDFIAHPPATLLKPMQVRSCWMKPISMLLSERMTSNQPVHLLKGNGSA